MKSSIFTRFLVLCLVFTGLSQIALKADEVTKNQALAIAGKVVRQYFPAEGQLSSSNILISASYKTNDPFYVCNVGQTGFVLIAKSDNCPPVLGFSWESNFPSNTAGSPALLNSVIGNIRNQCEDYLSRETVNPSIVESWKTLSSTKSGSSVKSGTVSPLMTTSWNNDSTFFNLYPGDFKVGGSVPIAMGQVFRYFGKPTSGTDELCFQLTGHGELCTKFDQIRLNFNAMSNTSGNPSVDSLIYSMAVTCRLQPGGATLNAYKQTLPVYFGYSEDMRSVESWEYNLADVIRHQLSLRRPVPSEWLGQAFVIDGYFPDNLFHFNMGWGGAFNGFYLLDYPVVKVDADHSLLTCYTDYHPKSLLPVASNIVTSNEGDSIRVSWTSNVPDSLLPYFVRFVVLRDGLVPVAQSTQPTLVVSPEMMGGSSNLRIVSDYGVLGSSELSVPYLYISDLRLANIPSLQLRILINTKLQYTDLVRQPFVGELDLIRDLEINFPDQSGIEKLMQLKNLRINGLNIRTLHDGDYLERLLHLRFYNCVDFKFGVFEHTRSLIQLYGDDYLPFDLYDFRHNTDLGWLDFTSVGTQPNMLMDLYGADKYFPKLADFFLQHRSDEAVGKLEDCFVSIESYLDVYPKIKSNLSLLAHTKPSKFAPCYPTPAREANLPALTRLSWQSNADNESGVYYNVFVGSSRSTLDLVSIFQSDKFYDGTFEPNTDYFWRVEAYHADSTYYSGIYHFSTWQDLPIPFVERFDSYYSSCPVADESPFWVNFDNTLTSKAVTNRDIKYDGFYSLEMKPGSDAGVVIKTPTAPVYYVEFRFLNKGGQVSAELLQKSGSSDENIVNSKIDFQGSEIGLFTYGVSAFPFNFVPDQWNRINLSINMTTGIATFMLNETVLQEWQWNVQIGGTANTNPFKGIRFVNNAGTTAGSGFVDNVVIDVQNPLSTNPVVIPEIDMVYLSGSREVRITGVQPADLSGIALYDLMGRKIADRQNPDNLIFSIGTSVRNGIYLVVVNCKDGRPFSRKIAVVN